MKINPAHLTSLRNEYSLLSYGPRCFAIIWGSNAFVPTLQLFIEKINMYNPHRVFLHLLDLHQDYTSKAFVVVEMKYRTQIHQKYFTCLMCHLSKLVSVWIHIWDTLEHDALRRDFTAPTHMDSELSINRLWLKNGTVFLINSGYSDDNPHGEYVVDISLNHAITALQSDQEVEETGLSTQLQAEFIKGDKDHMLEHVLDITNVYIPKSLVYLVSRNPHWITYPDFDEMDPTLVVLDAIPSSVPLNDEIPCTIAASDMAYGNTSNEELFSKNLTCAQWLSLAIKFNINKAFQEASKNVDKIQNLTMFLNKDFRSQCFLSSFLMGNLYHSGLARTQTLAKVQMCPDQQMLKDWNGPVCVLNKEGLKIYEELQRQDWQTEENYSESENDSDPDSVLEQNAPFFTGLEDTGDFSQHFSRKNIWGKLSAAIEDPELLGQAQVLSEKDLEQTAGLEDFDDFVEYYAKHFLGYNDEDLKKHRVQNSTTPEEEQTNGKAESKSGVFDWEIYNDDSEYESDYRSDEEGEIYA